ncbi:MAG: sodium/proton-translocating pyrophosphatase [candidate division KSB1 bacterium]|nr:sodium/proton-translocating pyrophosphatase [candidate division KSB1 bacterium]MDZ7274940.1 sodium/proton-translocating pyrophosphatase [candidate division KSB1 bacterium]MDZ7286609.1 sodium/proton-translocating pyrophosphatase [candidate division KSB1 bacterium]MDZ7299227.1 sodium/proton-translocating pyrophosphatase [candidate division KSB1 bacterium]MDZ7309587.1 sodium/proton-translocating pyrophosphatase [candidate division KSB1 bacterium]
MLLTVPVAAVLYAFMRPGTEHDLVPEALRAAYVAGSFVLGAICSGIAGYMGMYVSIRANIRTAAAARTSLNRGLRIALRGGAFSGLFVVAMSLLGVGGLFAALAALGTPPEHIPFLIAGYGFGASFVALFAQFGGGIYTKAAVVGDTVGDPCKDTAGPCLHVVFKLLSTITLVLAPLFISLAMQRRRGWKEESVCSACLR